jgi:serine protease Do
MEIARPHKPAALRRLRRSRPGAAVAQGLLSRPGVMITDNPRHILVVEDDEAALRSYGRLLARLGHAVRLHAGCDGVLADREGVEGADLLVLDQQMPGMRGLDLLETLRERRTWAARASAPPVLLVTAFADEALRRRAAALGVTAILDKPIDPAQLLGRVEQALCAASAPCAGRAADDLTAPFAATYTAGPPAGRLTGGIKESQSMKKHGQLFTLALIASGSVIFGMVLAGGLNLTLPGRAAETVPVAERPLHAAARAQMAAPQGVAGSAPASFADIAERVNPAVVSITATEVQQRSQRRTPFHGDPFEFFFGPQGPQNPHRRSPQGDQQDEPDIEQSGGSGFLISDDGYILTNYHVIEGATKIKVNLSDDRRDYPAEVVGSDPSTDLALVKIEVPKRLPFLTLGDSDALRIGDWVMAVGNPLQYEHTVTVGVVSAKGRRLPALSRDASLDNFIQTDAAINFGNSGGPLVNMEGQVVGVNTAISSVGQGIGFAVPASIASEVLTQLRTKGKVSRGYLGVTVGEVTPDVAEAWGLADDKGALVQSVSPGLPADAAGIKRGDVITAIDGTPVGSSEEVVRIISSKDPGSKVKLTVFRAGKQVTLTANLGDRPTDIAAARRGDEGDEGTPETGNETKLGITVEGVTPQVLQELGMPRDTEGVVVTHVTRISEAWDKGLNQGDIITEVNRVAVTGLADYRREIRKVKPGELVVLYVVNPPSRTGGDARSSYLTLRMQKDEQ